MMIKVVFLAVVGLTILFNQHSVAGNLFYFTRFFSGIHVYVFGIRVYDSKKLQRAKRVGVQKTHGKYIEISHSNELK